MIILTLLIVRPRLFLGYCVKLAGRDAQSALDTFIRVNDENRLTRSAADSFSRAALCTEGALLALFLINNVADKVFADTCRALVFLNVSDVFVTEMLDG